MVAVVVGLLAVSSIPRFGQTAKRLRAERAAQELSQLLRLSHARAVASGRPVTWVWDPGSRQARLYDVVGAAGEPALAQPVDERAARSAPLPEDVSVSLTREDRELSCDQQGDPRDCADCGCVHFHPDGTSEDGLGEAARLQVTHERRAYTATVDAPTGQVALTGGAAAR